MIGIKKKTPTIEKILIGDIEIPVHIRKNARSKRMSMRFNTTADSLVLILPKRASKRKGMKFLNSNINWIVSSIASLPPRKEFLDGASVPFVGNDYIIKHRPEAKRGVWIENDAINVSGQAEHLPRRVKDFIKKEARKAIIPRVHAFAEQIGKPVNHISLRDTRSRWGSCSSNGRISFSWRLVFAPEHVLNYVIAHEVAHLAEMNHSKDFWKLAKSFVPDMESSKKWLKANGSQLHRYG